MEEVEDLVVEEVILVEVEEDSTEEDLAVDHIMVEVVDFTEVPMEEDLEVDRITVEDSDLILDHILTHHTFMDLVWEGFSMDHHHHHQCLCLTPGLTRNPVVACVPFCD